MMGLVGAERTLPGRLYYKRVTHRTINTNIKTKNEEKPTTS